MNFGRLCRSVLRIGMYTTLIWILFAFVYLALPAPLYSDESAAATLQSGKPLTRVYRSEGFFAYNDPKPSVAKFLRRRRQYFIVEFQLAHDIHTNWTDLSVGGGYDPLTAFNFVDKRFTEKLVSLDIPRTEKPVVELEKPFSVIVGQGDTDGLSLPWFSVPDATLFHWWTQHDWAEVPMQARVRSEEKMVEIWPDNFYWDMAKPDETPEFLTHPLLRVRLSNDSATPPQFEFPPSRNSSSPSMTYYIRLIVLLLLIPLTAVAMMLFYCTIGFFTFLINLAGWLLFMFSRLVLFCSIIGVIYGGAWYIKNDYPPYAEIQLKVKQLVAQWGPTTAEEQADLVDLEAQSPRPRGAASNIDEASSLAGAVPSSQPSLVDVSDSPVGDVKVAGTTPPVGAA